MFGISRQKYYRSTWSRQKSQEQATKVVEKVHEVRREMSRIGTRKLHHILGNDLTAMHIGRDKLFAILRANHMLIKPLRSYQVTTNSHHRFRMHKNIIENLTINRPEQVWAADITYIGSQRNHLYLALITDVYSKKIVGYNLSQSLDTSGAMQALKMAKTNRVYPNTKLIHHSDRGIQYCSDAYQKKLKEYGIKVSMTENNDPYANAVAERVNGILKQEFLLETYNLPLKDMKRIVKDAICIYNETRPHSSCKYLTPVEMHSQHVVEIKTYKKINHTAIAV